MILWSNVGRISERFDSICHGKGVRHWTKLPRWHSLWVSDVGRIRSSHSLLFEDYLGRVDFIWTGQVRNPNTMVTVAITASHKGLVILCLAILPHSFVQSLSLRTLVFVSINHSIMCTLYCFSRETPRPPYLGHMISIRVWGAPWWMFILMWGASIYVEWWSDADAFMLMWGA